METTPVEASDNKPCLIFDFFGVFCTEVFNIWINRHNLEDRYDEAIAITRRADIGQISLFEEMQLLAKISGQIAEEVYSEFNNNIKINYELVDFVKKNKEKYRCVLLSNSVAEFVRPILKSYHLYSLFEDTFISNELHDMKPDSSVYWTVAKKLNVAPKNCVMIDDKTRNIESARSIGMNGIVYKMILNTR